ncbi:EAL domain-containing protein [Cryobacterium sp. MDB1-18-2]|uniref:putative bifunctional diguanylate cyclase/phosphodiesterase n=1 Tax=unclassified Cryobacterium TaxID=2649013 RepID=UPI00106D0359|nr:MULTISPECIES: EAL domain-containing protein [unclassified Cryobacterium]TFC32382.1 EAL domain-containing protein [Cryobacterium sp. MDB1-18-2]TFC46107.1 EAL domain-containing protein [Cryobacterium sp. MDB1-18-1]
MRARIHTGLVWAMVLVLAASVVGLAVHWGGWGPAGDVWFEPVLVVSVGLTDLLPVAVCWMAVGRVGLRRPEVLLAATAMTAYVAGDCYRAWVEATTGSIPFPSVGDVLYSLFYLLMLAALIVAVRRHVRTLASSVWLDCVVGSLGAAAVLAIPLSPVLDSALTSSSWLATVTAISFPLFDLLLVAAIGGIGALGGRRLGRRWVLLFVGLLVFAAADVLYALQVNANTYVRGTPLAAAWAIGLALLALWVDGMERTHPAAAPETSPATGRAALMVPVVATAAGLGVLLVSSRVPLSTLSVALAGATLVAATARTQVAFRQVAWMAHLRRVASATDDLTGLPNRRALHVEGHARLVDPERRRQSLLMLDLDKFKEVNDSLGHHAGDQLLVQVGARLREHLRPGDLLARLGGDEFAVLLEDAGHAEAIDVTVKLRAALAEPFALEDITLHTSVSVGIALFPDHGLDLSSLLRTADIAMYKAKTSGRGQHVYNTADDTDATTRLKTVEELRTALTTDQLVVHYQPKIDLDTGEVHNVEALVRWDHPTRGLLYPDAFLALVEESGLMRTLTRVVLQVALDQAAVWHAEGRPLTVAVNLSGSTLIDTSLPDEVAAMLTVRNLPPGALQLEITEEFLMADRDRARSILTRLRSSGIQISIDDFGTGYSSLSYLRDLPLDELKLDRSFVFPMVDDARAAALVASTIGLAHSLGLRLVAEGVETKAAYTELVCLGCDQAQGYYMSRPVPAAELDLWLSARDIADEFTEMTGLLPSLD